MKSLKVYVILASLFYVALVVSASTEDVYKCNHKYIKEGTEVLKTLCVELLKIAAKNATFFPTCLVKKHHESRFIDSLKTCSLAEHLPGDISYKKAINIACKNETIGDRGACCILTAEVKGTKIDVATKAKHIQECIDEWKKKHHKS